MGSQRRMPRSWGLNLFEDYFEHTFPLVQRNFWLCVTAVFTTRTMMEQHSQGRSTPRLTLRLTSLLASTTTIFSSSRDKPKTSISLRHQQTLRRPPLTNRQTHVR